MKFNLPKKVLPAGIASLPGREPFAAAAALSPPSIVKEAFYLSADESARRKEALMQQVKARRMLARPARLGVAPRV